MPPFPTSESLSVQNNPMIAQDLESFCAAPSTGLVFDMFVASTLNYEKLLGRTINISRSYLDGVELALELSLDLRFLSIEYDPRAHDFVLDYTSRDIEPIRLHYNHQSRSFDALLDRLYPLENNATTQYSYVKPEAATEAQSIGLLDSSLIEEQIFPQVFPR